MPELTVGEWQPLVVAVALVPSAPIMAVNVESTGRCSSQLLHRKLCCSYQCYTWQPMWHPKQSALLSLLLHQKWGRCKLQLLLRPTSVPNAKAAANTALGVKAQTTPPRRSHMGPRVEQLIVCTPHHTYGLCTKRHGTVASESA
jgi:hypothetical protein